MKTKPVLYDHNRRAFDGSVKPRLDKEECQRVTRAQPHRLLRGEDRLV
jgi:hypothetical protein